MHRQLPWEAHVVLRRAAYLAQMLRNESRTPEALAARQSKQLCALVRHAASQVPFYRDLYAAHGIEAASFKTLHDLQSLPMVDKQLLRAAGASALSRDAPAQRVTIRTSGSTGEPLEFQIDHRYDQWRKAQYLRPYLSSGQRLRDKVLRLAAHPRQRNP
jgi:phenylacetate-coenzyme A ligase PaaK-like adenylate-forming protein